MISAVLDGPAQTACEGRARVVAAIEPAVRRRAPTARRCAECGSEFIPAAYNQLFCATAHKRAFHNRQTARGLVLTPLAMAARLTRDGTAGDKATGKKARRDSRQLIALWAAEDREAGRLSMVEYVAARYQLGILSKLDG